MKIALNLRKIEGMGRYGISHFRLYYNLRDWKKLRWLVMKALLWSFGLKSKYKQYFENKKIVSAGYIKRYKVRLFYRATDPVDEIILDREYFHVQSFIPQPTYNILDAGGGVGEYSLIAARLVGDLGKVVTIEPNPESFQLLQKNIELNNFRNIHALNIALANSDYYEKEIFLHDKPTLTSFFAGKNSKPILVEVRTLDNVLRDLRIEKLDLLKIDVEGAELEVLKGATEILFSCKPRIIVEVHSNLIRKEVLDFLGEFNYEVEFEKVRYCGGRSDDRGLCEIVSLIYLEVKE